MAKEDVDGLKLEGKGVEELRYIQQLYQNQYTIAGNSINLTLQALQELNSAQRTLENLNLANGKEVLTSLGAEVYTFGKISNINSVVVAVGGGYLIEKDVDSAKTYITVLIKRHTDSLNKLTKSRKEIESALIEISYKLDSMR